MAGYNGYSMSNNAVTAYEFGEKPKSKWKKNQIMKELKEAGIEAEKLSAINKLSAKAVKKNFLYKSSWHHTSSHYNRTEFYSVDTDKAEEIELDQIPHLEIAKEEPKQILYKANIVYCTWEGTRNHPKCIKHKLERVLVEEKGCFYYFHNGKEIIKKKIGSNGTVVTKI